MFFQTTGPALDKFVPGELSGVFADFRRLVRWGLESTAKFRFWFEITQAVSLKFRSTGRFSMVCLFRCFESGFLRLSIRHK